MTQLHYFAYGSNMSAVRLQARTPSARSLGIHALPAHQLLFHKTGRDDSGKCNAFYTGQQQDTVIGILYQLDSAEKPALDKVEGLGWGYEIREVKVKNSSNIWLDCFTYSAIRMAEGLIPYDWYLHHVVTGASNARLPQDYIAGLAATPTKADPDQKRHALEMSLYLNNSRSV